MNLLLLRPDEVDGDGLARLSGRRAKHLTEILGAAPGDDIATGVIGGRMGSARVAERQAGTITLSLTLDRDPPAPPGIDLILALPRPKTLRRALRAAASIGVKRIVLVNAARVEKSYFSSPALEPERIEEELLLGLEQGADTVLPAVLVRKRFRPFVEDELAGLFPEPTRRLVAHPKAERPIEACDVGAGSTHAVLALGPDGGFVPFEVELLRAQGFTDFSLGPRPLRSDVALAACLAQLELVRRLAGRPAAPPA